MLFALIILAGCCLGRIAAGWAAVTLVDMNSGGLIRCAGCKQPISRMQRWFSLTPIRCQHSGCQHAAAVYWHLASALALGALFGVFSWLLLSANCQGVHEVRPDMPLAYNRLPFHLTLIFLLWVATLTDLLDYVITDELVYVGIAIAMIAAFATGELQMIHIWVNWDEAVEGLRGPYLPEWMKNHHHLHGIAWSFTGMVTGAIVTWLVRALSHLALGYPALGFGDVTLMAMIGAFLGWQPVLCVLALAPLAGILVGVVARLTTGKTFVAFGPYLACSAYLVICSWRWLWQDTAKLRDIFSHWPSVAGLIGFAFATLVILLVILRVFRSLPAEKLQR